MDDQKQKSKDGLNEKIVEKYYLEINNSYFKKFLTGIVGGLGAGLGLTIGTALVLYFVNLFDFVPVIGEFIAQISESAKNTR